MIAKKTYQEEYKDALLPYIKERRLSEGKKVGKSTIETDWRDMFYLERNVENTDFLSWFESKEKLSEAKEKVKDLIYNSSAKKVKPDDRIPSYCRLLDYFYDFYNNIEDSYLEIDLSKLALNFVKFTEYVRCRDNNPDEYINFRDCSGILGNEEGYKSRIVEEARRELRVDEWTEAWIGSGKIGRCAYKAVLKSSNLVFKQQKYTFKNIISPAREEFNAKAESILYDIFKGKDDKKAFNDAIACFGAKYDLIAFLFFIKDDSRFLPISPDNFDKSFEKLGLSFKTSRRCSWSNYIQFIDIISRIRNFMNDQDVIHTDARLIDAHSFVWIIHEENFRNWEKQECEESLIEQKTEEIIIKPIEGKGGKHASKSVVYSRSQEVVKAVRERAKGVCQLCNNPAPFRDKNGQPYLEAHHIVWLSKGGKDSTSNAVALCPNCHKKMHIVDDARDVQKLLSVVK